MRASCTCTCVVHGEVLIHPSGCEACFGVIVVDTAFNAATQNSHWRNPQLIHASTDTGTVFYMGTGFVGTVPKLPGKRVIGNVRTARRAPHRRPATLEHAHGWSLPGRTRLQISTDGSTSAGLMDTRVRSTLARRRRPCRVGVGFFSNTTHTVDRRLLLKNNVVHLLFLCH